MAKKSARSRNKSTNKKIEHILVVFRTDTPEAEKLAKELTEWLDQKKYKVFSHPKQKLGSGSKKLNSSNIAKLGLTIVLGGDGTYLEAARLLRGHSVPILGVNLGSLGFLTETRIEDLYPAVGLALEGKMESRPRSMIEVKIKRQSKLVLEAVALNDIVIERGPYSHLINLSIYNGRQHVSDVKADGLIIATPTGSTAYNLAAGGPILHPHVDALVITPVCPHALTNRPLIFPDDEQFNFQLNNPRQKAMLTVDGATLSELSSKDEILVRRAKHVHHVLRKPSHNYFYLLREKLKFGERAST